MKERYLKASEIIRNMEDAARDQMEKEHPSVDELLDQNIALMVNRFDLKVLKPIEDDANMLSLTWPAPSDKATLYRNNSIKVNGKYAAFSCSLWSFVNFKTRRIIKVKEVDLSKWTFKKYYETFPGQKFQVTNEMLDDMDDVGQKHIDRDDLDDNGHMNNIKYAEMFEENVPELEAGTHYISSFRLHFQKEATYNDDLLIKRMKTEDGKYLFQTFKLNGERNVECEIQVKPIG